MPVFMDQKVVPRHLGISVTGKVCGFTTGYGFARVWSGFNFAEWDRLYPTWRRGLVVTVIFDKIVTTWPGAKPNIAAYYPEEDLDVIDDDFFDGLFHGPAEASGCQ